MPDTMPPAEALIRNMNSALSDAMQLFEAYFEVIGPMLEPHEIEVLEGCTAIMQQADAFLGEGYDPNPAR